KKAAFNARAASSSTPAVTSIPAALRRSMPPRATGFGSSVAITTRATPDRSTASVHGGVRPWWLHGSSVTYSVAPRARSPAASSATTSACGPPYSACHPSPTTSSSCTTTAPTIGFGRVRAQPRSASARARRIHAASTAVSEREAEPKAAVPAVLLEEVRCTRPAEAVGALLPADLADQADDDDGERKVAERRQPLRAEVALADRARAVRGRVVGDVAQQCVARVPVVAEAGRSREQQEPLADRRAGAPRTQTVERKMPFRVRHVGIAVHDVAEAAVHARDGDAGHRERLAQDADLRTDAPRRDPAVESVITQKQHATEREQPVDRAESANRRHQRKPLLDSDGTVDGNDGHPCVDLVPVARCGRRKTHLADVHSRRHRDPREAADAHAERARGTERRIASD